MRVATQGFGELVQFHSAEHGGLPIALEEVDDPVRLPAEHIVDDHAQLSGEAEGPGHTREEVPVGSLQGLGADVLEMVGQFDVGEGGTVYLPQLPGPGAERLAFAVLPGVQDRHQSVVRGRLGGDCQPFAPVGDDPHGQLEER